MRLGAYQLQELLASSDDCLWYRALDSDSGRIVEVRLLADREEPPTAQQSALDKRLRVAALIDSPAVRSILHLALDARPPYLVLEWLGGPTLPAQQQAARCEPAKAVEIARQLASGLAAGHRVGLVHGGLRPGAIQARQAARGSGADQWTLDFTGLARELPGEKIAARALAAPELRSPAEASPAADVYGLAAVLYWLLIGEGPPGEEGPPRSSALEDALAAAGTPSAITSAVAALLRDALAVEPADRPAATEIVSRLAHVRERLEAAAATLAAELQQTQITAGPKAEPTPGDELEQSAAAAAPGRLGRFKLVEKLGEGGMGAVFRGEDLSDGTAVAVKVISSAAARRAQSQKRFVKEARLLAQVRSPFVANLLEFNHDNGLGYLVIEYVPGKSVGDWLRDRGPLGEPAALAVAVDTARGLAAAHQRGIVHRDLKPDNLLLTEAGATLLAEGKLAVPQRPLVKLSDFGLARSAEQTESLAITQQGTLVGTPLYMSPEQCRGQATDARSDVYSLGATLFHLLAGQPPFEADTHVGVMHKHCNEPVPALDQLCPAASDALQRVVEKTLAKNPDARYADADELLVDLVNLARGEPTSLGLHPRLPPHDSARAMQFEFVWELSSSPQQLWPLVANTDRLNQAMGLPAARFFTVVDPQRGVRRFAETRIAGQRIAWEEHPFEWIEGRRMSVLREFSRGPFRWFVNVVELLPGSGGGTRLVHRVRLEPANLLGRLLARLEVGVKAQRSLARIYEQIDGYVAGGKNRDPAADAFRRPAALPARRLNLLQQQLERLRQYQLDPQVIDTLGQFLQYAPDQQVARIRPRAFAERFALDRDQVLSACLHGAREGLLVLLWDLLCPTCRIPSDVKETLTALKGHGHCQACDVDFELDFSNSIEMIFRAAPEIRDAEVRTYCVGGPAFSAHVVAQTRLAAGERFQMELALPEGAYRLRGPQLPFSVDLRVTPRGSAGRCELSLAQPPPPETIPALRPGSQVLTLANDGPRELQIRLERTASRHDAVTAADASALALFRELFPGEILSPGQMVSVATVTLLMVELQRAAELYAQLGDGAAFQIVREALGDINERVVARGGAVVKFVGEGLVATFKEPLAAVLAAVELTSALRAAAYSAKLGVRMSLHRGPAMVTTLNDRLDYFGSTVHRAAQLLELAEEGDLVLTDSLVANRDITSLLHQQGMQLEVIPAPFSDAIVQRCRPGR